MGFKNFDVFPKLDNEFRVGTTAGGILSLLSLFAVIVLSYVEIHAYFNPPTRQRLIVDAQRPTGEDNKTISVEGQPRLNISFDITFPEAPCYLIHFDVIDPVTQLPVPLDYHQASFTRLSLKGQTLGDLPSNFLETEPQSECGSCYLENKQGCCKTCQDVFQAYKATAFAPPKLSQIDQCKVLLPKLSQMEHEGCRVKASLKTLRVASEFHIAPGLSWVSEGFHIHDLNTFGKTLDSVNLTHLIHRLQFTDNTGHMPLDGFWNVQPAHGAWRVVYTADILSGNFSVSRYAMLNPKGSSPGLFVKFDISPITATMYQNREPLLHLITRLVTVIGGVLGLFRFIDATLYAASSKKTQESIDE